MLFKKQPLTIFKSKWFQRFARKEGIDNIALPEAVKRVEKGQVDADLGGEVLKQRIARPGQGKSKSYRAIILFRRGGRVFFIYGFSKSERGNINDDEEQEFKEAAKYVPRLKRQASCGSDRKGRFSGGKS